MTRVWFFFALFLLSSVVTGSAYTLTALGFLGTGNYSYAYGVDDNTSVKVVGMSRTTTSPADKQAFVWYQGSMTLLPALSGTDYCAAYAINDSGIIVGECWTETAHTAVVWDASAYPSIPSPYPLQTLLPWHTNAVAYDINNNNKAVGYSGTTAVTKRACLWDVSILASIDVVDLGALPNNGGNTGSGYSVARAINNNDIVAGSSYMHTSSGDGVYLGCFWNASTLSAITITELAHLSGLYSRSHAYGVAPGASPTIVGYSWGSTARRAISWNSATPTVGTDLGLVSGYTYSHAMDMNSGALVVGYNILTPNTSIGFVWDSTNGMRNLTPLVTSPTGWEVYQARAINTSGKIAGYGLNTSSQTEAILLTP